MPNLTSSLTLRLIDDVTGPSQKVAAALAKAERQAKALAGSSLGTKFGNDLIRLGLGAKEIDKVSAAFTKYAASAGIAGNASKWTKEQASQVRQWENATVSALRKVNSAQQNAARSAQQLHREELNRRREIMLSPHSALGMATGAAAGAVSAHSVVKAAEKGADLEAALNKVRNVSNNEKEVALARDIATKASAANPYTTRTQAVEDYIEQRSLAVGHGGGVDQDAIRRNVMLMSRARAALASSGYALDDGEGKALSQALEGSGRAMDPNAQERMLDSYVRAKQVFGNAISADKVRDFVANAKASNFSQTDDSFFNTTMARLAQGNASRLGNEFSQTMSTLVGGHMTKQGAEWLAKMGLVDKGQIKKGGGGKFYIDGKIKNQDLLSADQTQWAQNTLLPGLEQSGILSEANVAARTKLLREQELKANPNAKIDEHSLHERATHGLIADSLMKSGFRSTVADNLTHAIANAYQTTKDVEQMKAAKGLDASKTIGQNPVAATEALGNAVSSFISTLTSPATAEASGSLDSMSRSIAGWAARLADWQKENPVAAPALGGAAITGGLAASGWLSYLLMKGLSIPGAGIAAGLGTFGLGGAAVGGGLAAGAANGAINAPMIDDFGNVVGGWGNDRHLDNPAFHPALRGLDQKATETKQKLGALEATVTPQINTASIDSAITKGQQLKTILSSLGALADSAATSAARATSFVDT